ncbi:MAG TPA: type II secretion system protein GspL [Usitatibacter sp.]|nr:type II secretion system protein GspL [Usitatibacter sp.]
MKLRLFVPAAERPEPDARWPWMLLDADNAVLREGACAPDEVPRASESELVLPASRVLFARLRLPRVGGATLRELLPFAVEDRLLADPSHIHAVAGATDRRGETLVAVIDREWLRAVLDTLAQAGIRPAKAWCESALLGGAGGGWDLVLAPARGLLVDEAGAGVAFDRGAGGELPLALRIALDESSARGDRPAAIRAHAEGDAALPDLARWSSEAGTPFERGGRWEELARAAPRRDAIDLLPREWAPGRSRLPPVRVPRAAWALLGAILALQVGLEAARTWSLSRERAALAARAEAVFRGAFPEAKAVVDARLQMERNLAELRRSRGLASGDDFLARLTDAARASHGPVRAIEYANGRLVLRRDGAGTPLAEAKR